MKQDLLKQEILKKYKNDISNLDDILKEAISEAENTFNKSLKQLCPLGEEKKFIIDLVDNLLKENKHEMDIDKYLKEFLKSDKSFKDFLKETISISGIAGNMSGGRGDLYDTTRAMINYKDFVTGNVDNDDINIKDKKKIWNKGALNPTSKNFDITKNVGKLGINKDTYFKGDKKDDTMADNYEIGKRIKFKNREEGETQEATILEIIPKDKSEFGVKSFRIEVTKGSNAGKIIIIRQANIVKNKK